MDEENEIKEMKLTTMNIGYDMSTPVGSYNKCKSNENITSEVDKK
jgi:hypothetical protein